MFKDYVGMALLVIAMFGGAALLYSSDNHRVTRTPNDKVESVISKDNAILKQELRIIQLRKENKELKEKVEQGWKDLGVK